MVFKKRDLYRYLTLTTSFSFLIEARSKREAAEAFPYKFNPNSLDFSTVALVNHNGDKKLFHTERVEDLSFARVEFAEHSGQFRVYGKMSVVLCSSNLDEVSDHLFQKCSYRIPGSLYADKTVWALSSGQQPLILQVHAQTAEWGAPVREDAPALVPIAQ